MDRSIWLLSLAAFFAAATTRACDALLPGIAVAFQVTPAAAAVAVTAFTGAYGTFQLLYGPVGARIGAYRTVALATALAAVGTLVCALSTSLGGLAAARAFSGLTAAAIIPMAMAHIGDTVPYERRQPVIARFLMGQITGIVFGQAFAGLFAQYLSFRQVFVALGVGFALIAAALLLELRSGRLPATHRPNSIRNPFVQYLTVLRVPWARVVLITVFLEGFLCFGAYPYLGVHLARRFDLDHLAIGLVLGAFGLGGLIYVLGVRWLLARLGEGGLAAAGGALLGVGYLAAAVLPVWPPAFLVTTALGLGYYMLHNTLQTNATQMAPFDRSAAIALFAFALFVSQALGATLLGPLAELVGYPVVFVAVAAALPVVALAFRRAKAAAVARATG